MKNYLLKKNTLSIFFLISFFLLLSRFLLPSLYYPGEESFIRLQFETKTGSSYLPIIKSYSNFIFSPLYGLENELDHKNLAFPYLALFIPIIFLKLFGPLFYIYMEFFALTFFLIVIYKIFILLNFNNFLSLLGACFLFLLPKIFIELNYLFNFEILEIMKNNFQSFYTLRMPRPLITNLYFFSFIFILMKINFDKKYSIKRSFFLGLLTGLSIHSLFFMAIIKFFILFFYLIVNYKKEIFKMIIYNKKFFLVLSLTVIVFLITFIIHLNNVSPDNAKVIGLHDLNYDQKINLVKYTIKYFSNNFFLLLFFSNLILFLYVKKKDPSFTIIYLMYVSTIITFLFFILFINKNIPYDLIQRTIFNNGILFFLLSTFKIITIKIKQFPNFIIKYSVVLIILLVCLNNYLYFKNYKKDNNLRFDADKVIKEIKKNNFIIKKDDEILVLDNDIFTYLVNKNYLNFTIVPNSFWTSRNFQSIENNLINSFRILGITKDELNTIFNNDASGFRILNKNVNTFFGFRYLANSNITFNGTDNYTENENKIIKKTSPFVTQLVMPKDEFKRILNNFLEKEPIKSKPKMIIINRIDPITRGYTVNINQYCLSYMNRSFVIYKSILYCK